MAAQRVDGGRIEGDGAVAPTGLRLTVRQGPAVLSDLAAYRGATGVKVDVGPPQSCRLAASHARHGHEHVERIEPLRRDALEEGAQLVGGPHLDVRLAGDRELEA